MVQATAQNILPDIHNRAAVYTNPTQRGRSRSRRPAGQRGANTCASLSTSSGRSGDFVGSSMALIRATTRAKTWAAVDSDSGEESVQLIDVLSRVSARNTFTSLGGDDGRREPMLWLAARSLGNRRDRSDTHDEDLDYNPFQSDYRLAPWGSQPGDAIWISPVGMGKVAS
ncbi:hypothetical protein CPLU01_03164 [Colletotrichum plurivorum]|uniref:Uncharacterized protein n=1 Tax=Colletotrichum plurivorum TaxID=2175906 RepID=A0A8H6KU38_9PEZI|nr:hypothetical protein CPLU01_03164 [Colletotrichum plurivorum]